MTVFYFPTGPIRPALAVVAAHGITDADSFGCIPTYAAFAFTPFPQFLITPLFFVMSTVHFSDDFGVAPSVALHATVGLLAACHLQAHAFYTMLGYLTLLHVPKHYTRCVQHKRHRALVLAGVNTVFGVTHANRLFHCRVFVLTNSVQRVIMAHIAHEFGLRHDLGWN